MIRVVVVDDRELLRAQMASWRDAAAVGLGVCLLQLGGYYLTAQMRGFPAGGAILVLVPVGGRVANIRRQNARP